MSKAKYKIPGGVEYDLLFDATTSIQPCDEILSVIPIKIMNIHEVLTTTDKDEFVCLYAIISAIGNVVEKTAKRIPTRMLELLDDSGTDVLQCLLWKEHSDGYDLQENDAVFIKDAKVNVYNNKKSVTLFNDGLISKSTDTRATELQFWCGQCIGAENDDESDVCEETKSDTDVNQKEADDTEKLKPEN